MNLARLILTVLLVLVALGTYATTQRYSITIGGGNRYYSVIKLDRWTGETWRLDNSGGYWNRIEAPRR